MKKIKKIALMCLVINIFLVMQLFCGSVFALNITNEEPDIIEISTNEILPMMASGCIINTNKSIPVMGNVANATYYYQSTGGSITFSIAYMNSAGNTSSRYDLISYNGMPLGHGNIQGPHIHTYTYDIFGNYTDNVTPYAT